MTLLRYSTHTIGRGGKRNIQFPVVLLVVMFTARQSASSMGRNMPAEGKDTPQSAQRGWSGS